MKKQLLMPLLKELIDIYENEFNRRYKVRSTWDSEEYLKFINYVEKYNEDNNRVCKKCSENLKDNPSDLPDYTFYTGWYTDYSELVEDYNHIYILRDFHNFISDINLSQKIEHIPFTKQ